MYENIVMSFSVYSQFDLLQIVKPDQHLASQSSFLPFLLFFSFADVPIECQEGTFWDKPVSNKLSTGPSQIRKYVRSGIWILAIFPNRTTNIHIYSNWLNWFQHKHKHLIPFHFLELMKHKTHADREKRNIEAAL